MIVLTGWTISLPRHPAGQPGHRPQSHCSQTGWPLSTAGRLSSISTGHQTGLRSLKTSHLVPFMPVEFKYRSCSSPGDSIRSNLSSGSPLRLSPHLLSKNLTEPSSTNASAWENFFFAEKRSFLTAKGPPHISGVAELPSRRCEDSLSGVSAPAQYPSHRNYKGASPEGGDYHAGRLAVRSGVKSSRKRHPVGVAAAEVRDGSPACVPDCPMPPTDQ